MASSIMEISATVEDIQYCQFSRWYPIFGKSSFDSVIIALPKGFLDYLADDSLILPKSMDSFFADDYMVDEDDEDLRVVESSCDSVGSFPELELQISSAIKKFGNQAFIKLNWSAPSDASWMNCGTLKCRNISEVYLLLKSSDRITYDVNNMFERCSSKPNNIEYTLVVRKWKGIHTAMEFRLFVYNKKLMGICQRDCCTYFDFLAADCDRICDIIEKFFKTFIENECALLNYTVDVYVDTSDKVWIVDFNPFGAPTDALLFQWDEFNTVAVHDSVEVRIIENEDEVLPSAAASYRGPVDVHLSHQFPNFMELCKQDNQQDSDSEVEGL